MAPMIVSILVAISNLGEPLAKHLGLSSEGC